MAAEAASSAASTTLVGRSFRRTPSSAARTLPDLVAVSREGGGGGSRVKVALTPPRPTRGLDGAGGGSPRASPGPLVRSLSKLDLTIDAKRDSGDDGSQPGTPGTLRTLAGFFERKFLGPGERGTLATITGTVSLAAREGDSTGDVPSRIKRLASLRENGRLSQARLPAPSRSVAWTSCE